MQQARTHYLQGNRFFVARSFERALVEWRRANRLWQSPSSVARRPLWRWVIPAFLATVLLVYVAVYTLFPRQEPFHFSFSSSSQEAPSFWERWLYTGRPQGPEGGSSGPLSLQEWWQHLKQRLRGESEGQEHGGEEGEQGLARGVPEAWRELLLRYGQLGPNGGRTVNHHLLAGGGLSRIGAYDEAARVLEEGATQASQRQLRARLYHSLGNVHYARGYLLQEDGLAIYEPESMQKATEAYEKSLNLRPEAYGHGNLGWIYHVLGDDEASIRHSERALRLNRRLDYVRLNIGINYLRQGREDEAFAQYRQVIERRATDRVYVGGINDLRELVRDHPQTYPFAWLMIGLLAATQGDFTRAESALTRFLTSPSEGLTQAARWRRLAAETLNTMNPAQAIRRL